MKKIILILLIISQNSSFAAVPTVEGLFRNSSNKKNSSSGLIVSYSIEEQQNDLLLQKTDSESSVGVFEGEMLKEKVSPIFIRQSILMNDSGKTFQSIKYVYDSSEMMKKNLRKIKFSPGYHAKVINEFDTNKRILDSLSLMYLFNNSCSILTKHYI